MIIRIDCDYAYTSRLKSFLATFLRVKLGKGYLENPKIIAKMLNNSPKEILCYWFVTTQTLPDNELLQLLNNPKHEICLHAVEDVYSEWEILVKHLAKFHYSKISYYFNQHGINRISTKIIWHKIRKGLRNNKPLVYFGNEDCVGLDTLCYFVGQKEAYRKIGNKIVYVHPDWLFNNGLFNKRGRYFEVLKKILDV